MFKGLTLNVLALGFTSLLTDVSSEMIFALLPFFMVNILRIEMAFVGFIEGAAEAVSSLLKVYSGWLSDKMRRRKPFAVLGYSISTISKPFFALASSAFHVLAVRILDRIGKGVRTSPRDALIADSISEEVRGKAYGFHRSMDTAGAIAGPLLAFLLLPILGYRGVFLASVLPGAGSVLLLVILVRETGLHLRGGRRERVSLALKEDIGRKFKAYIASVVLYTLGNFSYAFFLLRAGELGVATRVAPLLYLLFNIVYAGTAFPVGSLADRIGKRRMLALGYVSFALTCLGFAAADKSAYAILLFIAYGGSYAIADTLQRAIVPDLVEPQVRGSAFGVLHTATGLAALPSSIMAGALWQVYGAAVPFIMSAALSIAAVAIMTITLRGS